MEFTFCVRFSKIAFTRLTNFIFRSVAISFVHLLFGANQQNCDALLSHTHRNLAYAHLTKSPHSDWQPFSPICLLCNQTEKSVGKLQKRKHINGNVWTDHKGGNSILCLPRHFKWNEQTVRMLWCKMARSRIMFGSDWMWDSTFANKCAAENVQKRNNFLWFCWPPTKSNKRNKLRSSKINPTIECIL